MAIGLILHYSSQTKMGILVDQNSVRYSFSSKDWQEKANLKSGLKVTFDLNQDNQAINIRQEWLLA
ncbi:hypothetical protein GPS50_06080 [Acinetobacter haemolyticus]|uniref:Uncharacterized protein n=1 Tax=Acinetobacter haemolyticus TaxID=29430 RepID=A0A514TKF3_ACIHA|nr:hypothetical protein [Acinetobacter haemolyticus]ENW19118.1 hypothetical protein F926_02678 [Acinetobacter haemolyticus NIPH 261]NAR49376.1 hypothetical protein [Acinetobacter haemolyticus]NAR56481.1 hypothetical protein [Acinetobacter haemolyticus]NAR67700.1 hypothetical protein [Acinetobacter haemolyticus]NAR79312.1 hypothetical protein [Acinetobacter haemolyticus]